jgi:hypothetical protein
MSSQRLEGMSSWRQGADQCAQTVQFTVMHDTLHTEALPTVLEAVINAARIGVD